MGSFVCRGTSTYSLSRLCTVNCRPLVSNKELTQDATGKEESDIQSRHRALCCWYGVQSCKLGVFTSCSTAKVILGQTHSMSFVGVKPTELTASDYMPNLLTRKMFLLTKTKPPQRLDAI